MVTDERPGEWSDVAYAELLRVARRHMRACGGSVTVCTADVLHEAYFKLDRRSDAWESRAHFFASASRAIRQVLVERARRRRAVKRGGGGEPTTLRHVAVHADLSTEELLALDDALRRLEVVSERLLRVVELRFFVGLDEDEIAELLQVSTRTVERDWLKAKLFLAHALANG